MEKLTHSFLRKENELCNRIEEVEKAMGELNQNNQCFCENKFQRVGNFFFFFILMDAITVYEFSNMEYMYVCMSTVSAGETILLLHQWSEHHHYGILNKDYHKTLLKPAARMTL